ARRCANCQLHLARRPRQPRRDLRATRRGGRSGGARQLVGDGPFLSDRPRGSTGGGDARGLQC
ncbi:MAG: hypothetical protein AVDCRST_MAG88-547, partial [uncultured Thermomicrobiales bacterium]